MWILTANTRALSGQLCEMPCCVLKIGHKLKIDNGVCFLWNDGLHLDKGIGQMSLILIGLILLVLWKRSKEDIFCYQALKKQKKKEDLRRHTQAWSLFHTVQFKKKLMLVPFAWNIYSSTETEEIWKGNFAFCSFGSSFSNVYYYAVPCKCRVCTNVWVLKFGSYSVAMQQVNRIVTDMCARWELLPKTACQYEAIYSCLQAV